MCRQGVVFDITATPTKQELIDFYTTGKNTTNRARVKTLADVIAQELALDATAEVLADPKVQKRLYSCSRNTRKRNT